MQDSFHEGFIGSGAANSVTFTTVSGTEAQAPLSRLTAHSAVFELYGSESILRVSELLAPFVIASQKHLVYKGNATVRAIVSTGSTSVCEVTLANPLADLDLSQLGEPERIVAPAFGAFLGRWQKFCKIETGYKLIVAELQSFLQELRLWLDNFELGVGAAPASNRSPLEYAIVKELSVPSKPVLDSMFERFEQAARSVPEELAPAHYTFCRRQLHPLLLSSPFMYRIFMKPLGYAGDYEMVNMILRDPCEGGSLFAKVLNVFILQQAPAEAHRNRVARLEEMITLETQRVAQTGRQCRVLSIGCGPAVEIQRFLSRSPLAAGARFTLLDSNEETLQYTSKVLQGCRNGHGRIPPIELIKKSVQQLLKRIGNPTGLGSQYDFIYSGGLFDYLPDRVCQALIDLCYASLAPGGLLVATNVHPMNPIHAIMDHIYEWHLIYRDGAQLTAFASELVPQPEARSNSDFTGSNVFLEIRKPPATA